MASPIKKLIIAIIGLLLICAVLLFVIWPKNSNLEVTFFDIGQGDSILIRTPSGHSILIDGGPDIAVLNKLGRALPFYDHTIDLMVLTHAHSDHVAGLVEAVRRYDVEKVLYNGVASDSPDFVAWWGLVQEKGIETIAARAGQIFKFGSAELEVLYPFEDISDQKFDDLNDSSIIARLNYQDASFLLTGDATIEVEEELLEFELENPSFLASDVLKVGHHGSKYSSCLEFVQAVGPEYAIIQSGQGNRFGHPHKMVLKRLEGLGIVTLRNDEVGDIKVFSDGERVWVDK